jgi:putative addiction module killer protein
MQSETFREWFAHMSDATAKFAVLARIKRLEGGNAGDAKTLGDSVSEMRIDVGPGYRVYFTRRGSFVYLLLCGGDKRSQAADIKRAKRIVRALKE